MKIIIFSNVSYGAIGKVTIAPFIFYKMSNSPPHLALSLYSPFIRWAFTIYYLIFPVKSDDGENLIAFDFSGASTVANVTIITAIRITDIFFII